MAQSLQAWAVTIQQLDTQEFWLVVTLTAAATAGALYALYRAVRRLRFIADTPTSRIRSAAQGYVELEGAGELLPGPPIIAPLTGADALWYRYKIEERSGDHGDGRSGGRWRTLRSESSHDLFLLRDGTGECIIDPEGAEVIPSVSHVWYGDQPAWRGGPPPTGLARFLSGGRYRYTEKRIDPGATLYLMGWFRTVDDHGTQPPLQEEVRHLLTTWKRDQKALHRRFDSNGDGRIDAAEWERARETARRTVIEGRARPPQRPAHHLMQRPPDRRPYLLSALSQAPLLRRYRYMAAAGILFFLLAGGLLIWLLSVRQG